MSEKPVAWILTDEKINDLQVTTVGTIVRRAKAAHYCNVYLRINGKDELYQADWIKHMQIANNSQSPAEVRALAIAVEALKAARKTLSYCAANPRELHPMNNAQYIVASNALYELDAVLREIEGKS